MLLHEVLDSAAESTPDAPALIWRGEPVSFVALAARVARLTAALRRLAAPGERVAAIGENHPAWVDAYYAAPRAGLVLTFLNHRLNPAEVARIVASSGATVVLGSAESLAGLTAQAGRMPSVRTWIGFDDHDALLEGSEPSGGARGAVPASADDVAWLIYTSGTTGTPKGAMLTHRSILAAARVTLAARPVAGDDVYLFPFPLCHIAGYNVIVHHLRGRPLVLLPRFEAAAVHDAVLRHGVTTMSLAPTMISTLLDRPDVTRDSWSSVRTIAYGSSALAPALLRRLVHRLDVGVAEGYGMTELSGNAVFLGPDEHRSALDGDTALLTAAGKPGPGVEVRIVDDAMRDCPPGTPGEIVVRGEQVTKGYWGAPDATEAAFAGGWFHTGDIGCWDARGYLSIVDRKKDIIVTGGENVSSREVEDVLHAHPAVQEVAVIGRPDPHWGEAVVAVVVRRPGADVDPPSLVAHVGAHLAGFKKPKDVVFVDELPRNGTGKVLKHVLREQLASPPS